MIQVTTEQRTFIIKTLYDTESLQRTRAAFAELFKISIFQFPPAMLFRNTTLHTESDEYLFGSRVVGVHILQNFFSCSVLFTFEKMKIRVALPNRVRSVWMPGSRPVHNQLYRLKNSRSSSVRAPVSTRKGDEGENSRNELISTWFPIHAAASKRSLKSSVK